METSTPPSQDNLGQVVKRQVMARERPAPTPRPRRIKQRLFLLFCAVFLVVVFYMILTG